MPHHFDSCLVFPSMSGNRTTSRWLLEFLPPSPKPGFVPCIQSRPWASLVRSFSVPVGLGWSGLVPGVWFLVEKKRRVVVTEARSLPLSFPQVSTARCWLWRSSSLQGGMREKEGPEHFREVVQVNNPLLATSSFLQGLLCARPGLRPLHCSHFHQNHLS